MDFKTKSYFTFILYLNIVLIFMLATVDIQRADAYLAAMDFLVFTHMYICE